MTNYKFNKGFITQKVGDKTTIFSGEESILYTLNETAAHIFNGLKLAWSKEKIIKDLVEKYKTDKETAEKDFEELIKDLLKRKIISNAKAR